MSAEIITGPNKCIVCNEKSQSKCSNCKQVYYCSVEHQKSDWKKHKSQCYPFQVSTNKTFGRHLIATRDIKAGEIVIKESPIIEGPSQITCPVCVGCLQGLNESLDLECERCGWPICSRECQDRIEHATNECRLTVARGSKVSLKHYFSPHPTYQCMMTLRCLLLKESNPNKWKKIMQLESHSEERRGSDQWRSDREGVAKFIPRFFKCDNKWTEDEILQIAGIVQINGHEVPLTDPSYVAIYYLASLIQHSCWPNLTKSFTSKGEVIFWTTRNIRTGENLSICYSDVLWGTSNRQHHLQQTKMFKCQCVRCIDPTEFGTCYSALKCPPIIGPKSKQEQGTTAATITNVCQGLILPCAEWDKDWKCQDCGKLVEYGYVNKILDRAGQDLEAMEKGKEDNCIKYIEHYTKWLPEQHYYIVDVKIALVQIIGSGGPQIIEKISEEKLNKKIQLCQELLKLFKIIAPAEARILGAMHFELHASYAELGRRGAQQMNDTFRGALEESLSNANEVVNYFQNEPIELSEGQICQQAKTNVESLKILLAQTSGGDM